MKHRLVDFIYIFLTVALTVYGQLVVKWRVGVQQSQNIGIPMQAGDLARLLLDPGILSGLVAGLGAALCWMVAMSKFELSYAYPFTSLSYVLVLVLSVYFFREGLNPPKVAGVLLILAGTVIASRG